MCASANETAFATFSTFIYIYDLITILLYIIMAIDKELRKAQLDKDWSSIKRIFDKLNDICKEEADMNLHEFIKYKDRTIELCRYYSMTSKNEIGPYKPKFHEDIF